MGLFWNMRDKIMKKERPNVSEAYTESLRRRRERISCEERREQFAERMKTQNEGNNR